MTKTPYYDDKANWHLIPEHMHRAIDLYVMNGNMIGGFLSAIMANDFMGAATRADERNLAALQGWAKFLYNHVPANAHGSKERVDAWHAGGGIYGGMR